MTIGDIERTRLTNIKVMFFAGVNDGIVPKAAGRGGIISQYEREALKELDIELAPGAREQAFIQRFYLYLNMTKPSRELYISYTRLDSEKKAAQPSYLIGILKGMFPELVVTETEDVEQLLDISSRQSALDYLLSNEVDDRWCEIAAAVMLYDASVSDAGDGNEIADKEFTQKNSVERLINARFEHYSKDPISRNVARSIYGRHMEGSITRFEQFARCAYAHFLNYGLRLTEREESGFTSLDMGNIYHEALERYSKKLDRESTDWFSVTDAKRDELSMEAINEVIDEYAGFGIFDTAESQHSISHMKAVFKQTVWALTTQIRRGSFVPERFEFSFYESLDMANDVTVDIKGRVDRTDTYTDEGRLFVKVLDYKSGNTVFDLVKLYYGTQLQLAVYMDAVMEQKKEALKQVSVEPGGMLYYHIDDPVIDLKDVTPGTELSEEEINQMKMRFFINISHELRTPLTLILTPLQEIINKISDRWTRNQLEYIQRNANRLLHLVNQLMDYRRAELGVFELKAKKGNAHQLIQDNFLFYDKLARHKKITYTLHSELEDKEVLFDANYLELIVNNLLSNAFKYTESGQSITVTLKEENGWLLLQVSDTGIGIPINKQGKIFERFYQADNEHMGSGIGLSLVQRLVDLHHGRIELESREGEGSAFSIYLPTEETAYRPEEIATRTNAIGEQQVYTTNNQDMYIVDTEDEKEVIKEETAESDGTRKEKILIVEDNPDIRRYLSDELGKSYHISEAGNGEEALALMKEQEADLILTDVMMPVMDGLQLCKQIKQNLRTCHIPIIILSAKADLKEQLEGLQVGADDYIPKPFSMAVITTKIRNLFRTRHQVIEHYSNSLEVEPEKVALNPMDEELLKKAVAIVEKHMDDVEFSTDDFAREICMSRSNLHLKLKALTGDTTNDFIRKIRFNRACKLLKEERYTVAEISAMVGFNTPSYFSTSFKKYFGCLPSEYIKS